MQNTRSVKARFECGASMPLALLLFLICALLASVVLSAATTVGGRHAQLAEADQRYYSVVSAANLLKQEIGGEKNAVTVVVEEAATSDANGVFDEANATVKTVKVLTDSGEKVVLSGGSAFSEGNFTVGELAAIYQLFGGKTVNADKAKTIPENEIEGDIKTSYTLEHTGSPDGSKLNVAVTEKQSDGQLSLTLDSEHADDEKDYFTLTLFFDADINAETSTLESTDAAGARTQAITKTVVVTWLASDLTKAGA